MTPEMRKLLADGITIIEAEREVIYKSYRIGARGHPDFGTVTDKTAKRDLDRMDDWLKRAREASA